MTGGYHNGNQCPAPQLPFWKLFYKALKYQGKKIGRLPAYFARAFVQADKGRQRPTKELPAFTGLAFRRSV
jgi:hypothetical protein